MATENITVVRDPQSPTATFNTKTRVLTLPVYNDAMSKSLADGLVGHEVGHALFTPSDEATIMGAMNSIDPNNPAVVHDYLNVIEDARIERMMKAKFPGLRRTFGEMYTEMMDKNFFGVADKNIGDLPLVDRLNLHFKAGLAGQVIVPFSAEEKIFVKMMEDTKTFDDVVNAARELYDYVTQPKQDQQQPENGNGGGAGDGNDQGSDGDGSADDQQDGDQGAGDADGSNGAGQQDQTATPTMASENGNNTMDQSGGDADSEKKSQQQGATGSGAGLGENKQQAPEASTNNAMSKALNNQRNTNAAATSLYRLPKINLDKIIVDFKTIHDDINAVRTDPINATAAKNLKKFTLSSRDYVQTLVREFERKMAADEQRRSFVSRTGTLDMSRVHTYRFNDDLFLKSSWVADGKNHGMVMFIDWSGSMHPILENTLYQVLNLVMFCNALRIPFEVYAFSSVCHSIRDIQYNHHKEYHKKLAEATCEMFGGYTTKVDTQYNETVVDTNGHANLAPFSLLNLCSSRMSKNQMRNAMENLLLLAKPRGINLPGYLGLGGTPLDEATVAAIPVVNEFRKSTKTQIVNTIFLTDGQSGSYLFRDGGSPTVRAESGHTYTPLVGQDTSSFLRTIFRGETGSSLTGFFLVDRMYGSSVFWSLSNDNDQRRKMEDEFLTNNFVGISDTRTLGYDTYFVINASVKSSSNKDKFFGNAEESLMASAKSKKSTRALLSQFTDTIAKDFVY